MESYNESFNSSSDLPTEEVPLFVTYLNMVIILMVTVIVITPAVVVINIIRWTKELHTKYYFFVANLLATNVASIIVRGILQYLIMIIYLLHKNSNFAGIVLKFSVVLVVTVLHLMTVQLPITLAAERMIVIGFPYRHRSIMTTKTVATFMAVMWGLSAILAIIITAIVPIDVVWPLALVDWDATYLPFILTFRLTSALFIIVANVFLQYKTTVSNRKAKENERLGNEAEAKKFEKVVQMLREQAKLTITLLVLGGIDVIANLLIPTMFVAISLSVKPYTKVLIEQFFLYPLRSSLLLSHPLVYGLYMKKIRQRLPKWMNCKVQWNIRHSKVTRLNQQP